MSSIKSSETRSIGNSINPVNYFETYPFTLETFYSYQTATDKPLLFSGSYSANLKLYYKGVAEVAARKSTGTAVRNYEKVVGRTSSSSTTGTPTRVPGASFTANCINISSLSDRFSPSGPIPLNNGYMWRSFEYTYDIDNGNGPDTYAIGASGLYVRYIQAAIKAGKFYSAAVDGSFGPTTLAGVSSFQSAMKAHRPVYNISGRVDSETKALLAFAIKNNLFGMSSVLNQTNEAWINFAKAAVTQIGSSSATAISRVNQTNQFKKISYTGVGENIASDLGSTVNQVKEYLFFEVPARSEAGDIETVQKIIINFGSDPAWRKLKVVSWGYSSGQSDKNSPPVSHYQNLGSVDQVEQSYKPNWTVNQSPDSNGDVVLDVNNKISNGARYFYAFVQTNAGETIGGRYGKAEGFNVSSIKVIAQGLANSSNDSTPDRDITEPTTETYIVFPSLVKPDDEKLAAFWLQGNSSLYYDGNNLKSTASNFLLYTSSDDEFWKWDGSDWENQEVEDDEKTVNLNSVSTTLTYDVYGYVNAVDSNSFRNLNATQSISVTYDTNTIKSKNLTFQTLNYEYLGSNYTENISTLSLATGEREAQQVKEVTFNLSSPYTVTLSDTSSVSLSSVSTESGSSFASPLSAISIAYTGQNDTDRKNPNTFTLATSATYYSGSNVIVTPAKEVSNYYMMTPAKIGVPKKESITSLDGVVLICDYSGSPLGLPKASEITSYFSASSLDEEKDSRFGFIFVRNILENKEGFIFGFYDIRQKEFLGQKVAYVDILSRGINNIYLAVTATDADGNSQNQIDFIGPKVSTTFIPADIPIKRICPVYSVSFKSSSAIQIGNLSSFIDKKEAWPLSITTGSFTKNIQIPLNNRFTDWKSKYIGQKLRATYDTSSAVGVNWSNIFGRGYYDVLNEKPILISDKQIKLRQAPFLVWPEPSSYKFSKVNLFKPQFEIYTKESENDDWVQINFSEIRDYNSNSGVIEFKNKIVPNDENLIKVNYVRISSDLLIYQIEGSPVPLNPFLNSENIQLNKALYVYIVPTKIDKFNLLSEDNAQVMLSQIPVSEYTNKYPFGFTYNQNIFNKNSNQYDPFALPIGIIYFINNPKKKQTTLSDTRLRGGGVKANYSVLDLDKTSFDALSHWDTYPHYGLSYPKGGFIIIKLPEEIKNNFIDVNEIYDIIRKNLTAGISFQIQDLNGKPWEI